MIEGEAGRRVKAGILASTMIAMLGCDALTAATGPDLAARLAARLATIRPGETIRLEPGDYGAVAIPKRSWSPAIRIEADGARFASLSLEGVRGVTIRGGSIVGPGVRRDYGIWLDHVAQVRIENMQVGGVHRALVLNESSDVAIVNNRFVGVRGEGVNIALSRRVLVARNTCRDFNPRPGIYDAAGNRIQDGDHPDCIQAWSRPTAPPVADIQVIDNVMEGRMQGIFFGNHVRDGVDDGGFDRVTIRGNWAKVSFGHGISLQDARDSAVIDNVVTTVPGAMMANRPVPVRANINVRAIRSRVCGNKVPSVPRNPANLPCPPDPAP